MSSSVMTLLPFKYLALKMKGTIRVTGAESYATPSRAIEMMLGLSIEKLKAQGRKTEEDISGHLHFLYILLWVIKKLPGMFSLSNHVSGITNPNIICEKSLDYPPRGILEDV